MKSIFLWAGAGSALFHQHRVPSGSHRLSDSICISSFAIRSALSRFRCKVCWDVPGEKRARAFSVLPIIETNACRTACRSSRVQRSVSSVVLVISSDAMCSALRLSRSIACCHVPGATFCWAFSDLLISEAIGRNACCTSSFSGSFMGLCLCWPSRLTFGWTSLSYLCACSPSRSFSVIRSRRLLGASLRASTGGTC